MQIVRSVAAILLLTIAVASAAKPNVEVKPAGGKYFYQLGDSVTYEISAGGIEGDYRLSYELSRDQAVILSEGTLKLSGGKATVRGSLDMPGFLRCDVALIAGTDTLAAATGCGFAVNSILPTGLLPKNYEEFWKLAKVELTRFPIDARLEEVEAKDPGDAHRYKFSLAHPDGSRIYGFLHLPPGDGPLPTILSIPGSGVGRTGRFAKFTSAGFAVLSIEILGLNPSFEFVGSVAYVEPADSTVLAFRALQDGILKNYHELSKDDPYHYIHRRSVMACLRAMDYLHSRSDVDTTRLGAYGGSQGGGLSIILASIDKRVKAVGASVPGFCDHTAYLYGRAGKGPRNVNGEREIRTLSYYDAALAAGLVDVPTLISVGVADPTCHPTKVYAAFNNLRGPKRIDPHYQAGHGSPPEWRDAVIAWFKEQFSQ